jgi:transposase InsO family protein
MVKVASSVDNALIESFWSFMQAELLDRQSWTTWVELASAMFEWIEGWYNPERRNSRLGMVSPAHFEELDNNVMVAA